jgi:hypothetical protein
LFPPTITLISACAVTVADTVAVTYTVALTLTDTVSLSRPTPSRARPLPKQIEVLDRGRLFLRDAHQVYGVQGQAPERLEQRFVGDRRPYVLRGLTREDAEKLIFQVRCWFKLFHLVELVNQRGWFVVGFRLEPPHRHGSFGLDVRSALFSEHVPPHERPAEPIELHRDRRRDGSVSADYWRRSEHQVEQTKAKVRDRLRHSPSEQRGYRRPHLHLIRSNSADQRGRGGTEIQEQKFWQRNGRCRQGSGWGGPADHPTHPCLFQCIEEVEEEGRGGAREEGG